MKSMVPDILIPFSKVEKQQAFTTGTNRFKTIESGIDCQNRGRIPVEAAVIDRYSRFVDANRFVWIMNGGRSAALRVTEEHRV